MRRVQLVGVGDYERVGLCPRCARGKRGGDHVAGVIFSEGIGGDTVEERVVAQQRAHVCRRGGHRVRVRAEGKEETMLDGMRLEKARRRTGEGGGLGKGANNEKKNQKVTKA